MGDKKDDLKNDYILRSSACVLMITMFGYGLYTGWYYGKKSGVREFLKDREINDLKNTVWTLQNLEMQRQAAKEEAANGS